MFAGDLMPLAGWSVPDVAPELRQVVERADWFLANCEGPLCRQPDRTGVPGFQRERATVDWLEAVLDRLGARRDRTVLTVANNHALDRGEAGYARTVDLLAGMGVRVTGTLQTGAATPALVDAGNLRLAVVAWSEWMNRAGTGPARWRHIRDREPGELRSGADVLIGLPHWDLEMAHVPSRRTVARAGALLEAGFDLLVGHHPHVLQPIVHGPDGLCAHSLGSLTGPASWLPASARLAGLLEVGLDQECRSLCGHRLHLVCQLGRGGRRRLAPLEADAGAGSARRRQAVARLFSRS